MWKFFDSTLERLFALLGALLFSQAPAFFQQYLQRLGGAADELKRQVLFLEVRSTGVGLSLRDYIRQFSDHTNPIVAGQGEFLTNLVDRYASIQQAFEALSIATPLSRPYAFLETFQSEVAFSTLADFQPAFSITVEGVLYAFAGLAFGALLYRLLRSSSKRVYGFNQSR